MNEIAKVERAFLPSRDDLFFPFEKAFDNILDSFFSKGLNKQSLRSSFSYPKMDIFKEDGKYVVKAAVPGVSQDNVKIEIDQNNVLKVSGSSSEEHKSEKADYFSKELRMSQFSRAVQLPDALKGQNPVANMVDGILTLTWELKEEAPPEVRRITISPQSS